MKRAMLPCFMLALTLMASACTPALAPPRAAEQASAREVTSRPDFSSPQATLDTLVKAIRARNLATYSLCFSKHAHERGESGMSRIAGNPEKSWTQLGKLFTGPQTLILEDQAGSTVGGRVHAPQAHGGGIGAMRFEEEADGWKVRSW